MMTKSELREKVLEVVPENLLLLKSDEELRSCDIIDKMTIFVYGSYEINLFGYMVGKFGDEYTNEIEDILYQFVLNELECRKSLNRFILLKGGE